MNNRISMKAIPLCIISCLASDDVESAGYSQREMEFIQKQGVSVKYPYLTANDTTENILKNHAFNGFSPLILPWNDLSRNIPIAINDIQSLLPYHTQITPKTVVTSLNRMIDDVNKGETIFYNIYSGDERQQSPDKSQTGLFFFRGRKNAPFAIICPGGGFEYVGSLHEGFPYANEINKLGYNAFVLRYRVGLGGHNAVQDLARAISFIFQNSSELQVSTQGYSLWGSSAGARMAAAVGSYGVAQYGGDNLPKPAAVIMAYTGYSDYSLQEPPTFVVVGSRDGIAPPTVMRQRIDALKQMGTNVEYHQFPNVGHGFGLGEGTSAEGWILLATQFWKQTTINK
jgi:acetyl esterase/lipase